MCGYKEINALAIRPSFVFRHWTSIKILLHQLHFNVSFHASISNKLSPLDVQYKFTKPVFHSSSILKLTLI